MVMVAYFVWRIAGANISVKSQKFFINIEDYLSKYKFLLLKDTQSKCPAHIQHKS